MVIPPSVATLLSRGLAVVSNVALAVLFPVLYGADDAGWYFLAFTIVNILCMVARVGTENEVLRAFPGLMASGDTAELRDRLRWLRMVSFRSTVLGGAVVLAGSLALAPVLADQFWQALALLSVVVPLAGNYVVLGSTLRSVGAVPKGTILETGLNQFVAVIVAVLLTLFGVDDPLAMPVSYVAGAIVCVGYANLALRKQLLAWDDPPGLDKVRAPSLSWRHDSRRLLFMMAASVLHNLLISSPIIFLGAFSTSSQVALYNSAARLGALVALIPTFQAPALLPVVSALLSRGDAAGATRVLSRAARVATIMACTVAGVLSVAAPWALSGTTDDLAGFGTLLIIVAWGQAVTVSMGQVNPVMNIAGLGARSTVAAAFWTAGMAIPISWAAASVGAVGACAVFFATLVAYAISCNEILRRRRGVTCHAFRG